MVARAYGFDFGTSNSAVASCGDRGGASLVELVPGHSSIPTAVFFSLEDGRPHFGREAIARYLLRDEGRLLRSLKSILGSDLYDDKTSVGARRIAFADIVAAFIGFARNASGAGDSIVLGRPVHFVDDDAEADARAERQLRAAAIQAGFRHVEFQFEPIAAALDYEQSVGREERALVMDIGGGTSDFSIVKVSPHGVGKVDRKSDILAFAGVHVGGNDLDRLFSLATLMPHLGFGSKLKTKNMNPPPWYYLDLSTWQRINNLYEGKVIREIVGIRRDSTEPEKIERLLKVLERRLGHELLGQIEAAKIALSRDEETRLASVAFERGQQLKLSRARFEKSVAEAVARIGRTIRTTLEMAAVAPGDIDTVFVTGGSSALPILRSLIATELPSSRIVTGDAFGSVATGLALDARRRF